MGRRTNAAIAEAAAQANAASEAARTLGQRSAEVRAERSEPANDKPETPEKTDTGISPSRIAELRANNPTNKIRDELTEMRDKEAGNIPPETPEESEVKVAKSDLATPPADSVPAGSSSEPVVEATEAVVTTPETVRVKVDGEEFDVPKADVDAAGGLVAYQKERAAEKRLRAANEAVAEAKKIAAQIMEAAKPKEPPAPVVPDVELIDKLRFGTPEESAAALQQLTARNRVDPAEITQRAMANIQFNAAERQFHRDFADLAQNPLAARLVKSLKEEALQKHVQNGRPDWNAISGVDWIGFFNTMGTQIRSAFGRPHQSASTSVTTPGTTSPQSEKEARKASISNPPSTTAKAEVKAEDKPGTPEEEREAALRFMRKARGQPVD